MNDINQTLRQIRADRDLSVFDLCSIDDFTDEDIKLVFELAAEFKKNPDAQFNLLEGKKIFNIFFENSTRTRSSFQIAANRLGASVVNISSVGSSIKKGESPLDTLQNLAAMTSNAIIIRTDEDWLPKDISPNVKTPIINAGDGKNEHPTQALLDHFTFKEEFGEDLNGKTVAFIGDTKYSRVFGSNQKLAKRNGMNIKVFSPKSLLKDGLENADSLESATKDADIVYVLRVQKERGATPDSSSCVTPDAFALAKDDAILMHPGPVIWEEDISSELRTHERNYILKAVENGVHVRTAILWLLADREDNKDKPFKHA